MLLTYVPRKRKSISLANAKTSKPESSATTPANPKAFDKLYWLRVGPAVLAGAGANYVFGADYANGALVGIILYLASYYLARYFWFKDLSRESLGKIYSTGIGGYVFLFIFTWILLFTVASA